MKSCSGCERLAKSGRLNKPDTSVLHFSQTRLFTFRVEAQLVLS
jgi:hypothetical protein